MNSKRIGAFFIDFIITAMIMNIPFWLLVIYPTIKGNQPSDIILRTLLSTFIAFIYLILRDLPSKGSVGKRILKLKIINSETKEIYIPYYNEMYEEIYVIGIDDDTILNYKGPINSSSETKEDLSEYISVSGYKRHGMDYDFEVVSEDGSIRKTKNGIDSRKVITFADFIPKKLIIIW